MHYRHIPPLSQVVAKLKALPYGELQPLADRSGVSVSTITKIRVGYVTNPGYETVSALLASLPSESALLKRKRFKKSHLTQVVVPAGQAAQHASPHEALAGHEPKAA